MSNIDKYTRYFMAQATGKLPNQRGGSLLTVNKALDWVTKFCDVASHAAKIVSPLEMIADRVKNEALHDTPRIKEDAELTQAHKRANRKRKKPHSHLLIKRFKKDER